MGDKNDDVAAEVERLVIEIDPPPATLTETVQTLIEHDVQVKGWKSK